MIKLKNRAQLVLTTALCMLFLILFDGLPQQFFGLRASYAQSWLGADTVIQSPGQWQDPLALQAESLSIKVGTMLFADEQAHLVNLQLIDEAYPLSGVLAVSPNVTLGDQQVYVSPGMLKHGIDVGSEVEIGGDRFEVVGVVSRQDEQVFSVEGLSPSVYMPLSQRDQLGLFGSGSRAVWYYYYSNPDVVNTLMSKELPGVKVLNYQSQLGRLDRLYNQATDLMLVMQLTACILVGMLLHLAVSFYHQQIGYACGTMKSLGLPLKRRMKYLLGPLLMWGGLGIALGFMLGLLIMLYAANYVSAYAFELNYVAVLGRALALMLLYMTVMCATHHILMQRTQTLILVKSTYDAKNAPLFLVMVLLFTLLIATTNWDLVSLLRTGGYIGVAVLALYGFMYVLMQSVTQVLSRGGRRCLVVLNSLRTAPVDYAVMLLSFTAVMFMSLGLWHIQHQALASWERSLPDNAPNYFILGLTPASLPSLKTRYDWLEQTQTYNVVKGRLIAVNGQAVGVYDNGAYKGHEVFNRQLNLTAFDRLPDYNRLIVGKLDDVGISAEKGIMLRIGLSLGDELTFDIMGESVSLPITSIREVEWQSLQANFYFAMPPKVLDKYPATVMASVYISDDRANELQSLVQRAPQSIYLDIRQYLEISKQWLDALVYSMGLVVSTCALGLIGAGMLLLLRQAARRKKDKLSLVRISLPTNHLLLIDMMLVLSLASFVSIGLLQLTLIWINRLPNYDWYFDPMSMLLLVLIWLGVLVYTWYYDKYVLKI